MLRDFIAYIITRTLIYAGGAFTLLVIVDTALEQLHRAGILHL